jgi:hypothetical protein
MKFYGQPMNIDWDHAIDVYGERHDSAKHYKKRNGMSDLRLGTGSGAGMSKEIIELRLSVVDSFNKSMYHKEFFFESYQSLLAKLHHYKLNELNYGQFMKWIAETADDAVSKFEDHTILSYKIRASQFESNQIMSLNNETPDDILLPRGVQNA